MQATGAVQKIPINLRLHSWSFPDNIKNVR